MTFSSLGVRVERTLSISSLQRISISSNGEGDFGLR